MANTNFETAKTFLTHATKKSEEVFTQDGWSAFKANCDSKQWLYLYGFGLNIGKDIVAFGTSTNSSDRVRKASIFNSKLTGKYDRRIDYLMLKQIYGMPRIIVFEAKGLAVDIENELKQSFGQNHCYRGLQGADRKEIASNIVLSFQSTSHYQNLPQSDKVAFEKFLTEIYFAFRKHPLNPKRTFFWGDCLEPGFLKTIDAADLEPVVERVLKVRFYD